ncbi:MAG: LysM peptidoglycan-binding domain-containing protein [candidate division Zixibacteria bacterium]|nr:LysM peptidoglycan-binding domain-containing protein [candidate division Zixibacteria bacterium]
MGSTIVRDSATEAYIRQSLAEAEALYSTGVAANRDGRWSDAQLAFEQATSILADLDLDPSEINGSDKNHRPSELQQQFTTILREIARDYRVTLEATGQLDPDSPASSFLWQFDSGDSTEADVEDTTTVVISEPARREAMEVQYDFPIEYNNQVINCIVYFQTLAREPFETFIRRSGRYLPMMKEIVASYGLPTDIAYLPLIESGFNNRAYSYAHASGPWQFIASTGRKYSLDRTTWVDERRDFEKSTHAACMYLRDLYKMFGSWTLALASYNGGEGRVSRQIARQGTNDFWKLKLRDQTMNYVPLFMAALMIAKDPETFGFHVEPDPPLKFDWVATDKTLELKEIGRALSCEVSVLEDLNPELRRGVTPPGVKPYRLRVPPGLGNMFAANYPEMRESKQTVLVQHVVRRGETISEIAQLYGVTTTALARRNNLGPKKRLQVGQSLAIPGTGSALAEADDERPAKVSKSSKRSASSGGESYTIKRGETLWELAKRFGTTTSAIRRANNLSTGEQVVAGQSITIPGRSRSTKSADGTFWYTIRRGDTLTDIAAKYGLGLRQLLASNGNIDPHNIRVGQRIRVPRKM